MLSSLYNDTLAINEGKVGEKIIEYYYEIINLMHNIVETSL
jgi:hypothetical protein